MRNRHNHPREYYNEKKLHLQATTIDTEDKFGPVIFCLPKHNKKQHYENFFNMFGDKFIAGGYFNTNHTMWGSSLRTTKCRELVKTMIANNIGQISISEPIWWPSDKNKIPDAIAFYVTKGNKMQGRILLFIIRPFTGDDNYSL